MTRHRRSSTLLVVFALMFGATSALQPARATVLAFPGDRPFNLYVPSNYAPEIQLPLIIALHGFAQSGDKFEKYLNINPIAETKGFLYVHPDGTSDPTGNKFWNATPECCDYQIPKVDDDAYLMSIIDQVSQSYSVDPIRIFIIGHSNGGFMANVLACKHADRIAAIVNIAGGSFITSAQCKPQVPINILQIWGTKDVTYSGNHFNGKPMPGALKTITTWAGLNHCSKIPTTLKTKFDLDRSVAGYETQVLQFPNCAAGISVEYWRMSGVSHVPNISRTFTSQIIDYLLAHPKHDV